MSTVPFIKDGSGYSVVVDDSAPESTTIHETTSISISRLNRLDLTVSTGNIYQTLKTDPITLSFTTSEPLSSVSVSLAGNIYDCLLYTSDTADQAECPATAGCHQIHL